MLALEALEKEPITFDKIIVDETQDLMIPDYLGLYDSVIKGGLKKVNGIFSVTTICEPSKIGTYASNQLQNCLKPEQIMQCLILR